MFELNPDNQKHSCIRQEHNIDGWQIYEFIYRDGLKSVAVFFHTMCGSRVSSKWKKGNPNYHCKKCGIKMPRETDRKVRILLDAIYERLPTP